MAPDLRLTISELFSHFVTASNRLPALSRRRRPSSDEPYEIHESSTLSQRQQRRQPLSPHSQSRASSSSGSNRTLRRTPRLVPRATLSNRLPTQLADPVLPPLQSPSDTVEDSTTPASSAPERVSSYWPRRTTRISRNTANAIRYALEATRGDPEGTHPYIEGQPQPAWTPRQFTPDFIELYSQMSDLVGGATSNGRTQNGGSRAAGPVPQPFAGGDRVRTPTDIMRERRDREARKKAESERRQKERDEEEQLRAQAEKLELDRRNPPAGVAPEEVGYRRSSGGRRSLGEPSQDVGERRQRDRGSGGSGRANIPPATQPGVSAPSNGRAEKVTNASQEIPPDSTSINQFRVRPRGTTLSTGQPRPVETKLRQTPRAASASATAGNQKETLFKNASANASAGTSQARAERSGQAQGNQPLPSQDLPGSSQSRSGNISSFPHAFERWETLSSHWEGLTSFWIRRLEQHKEDVDGNPINQQMARQVTDLSAAGANLFHAVVELQRLRASSERKFQRWFFETRAEQERFRETQSKFEERLRNEQQVAADAQTALARLQKEKNSALSDKTLAGRQVDEIKRELEISKKEARRAWEELGRREQEERDRTISLKQGQVTIVGGVQVVPMIQGGSRQGSTNRPSTREGPTTGLASLQAGSPTEDEPGYTTYDPARSETDTDPFTEGGRINAPPSASREPERISTTTTTTTNPYQQTSNTSAAAVQAARATLGSAPQHSSSQQARTTAAAPGSGATYLRYGPDGSSAATSQPGAASFYQHEGTALQDQPRITEADERSFVPSIEDTLSEEDYELNENGEVRRDAQGRPIPGSGRLGSEDSDEYDVQEQLERERMYGRRYGSSMSGVEYGSGPATAGGRQPSQDAPADYTGSGFGPGWEAMVPRHHHPTRLSDVLEEDERSRTSPSRASQHSRGIH